MRVRLLLSTISIVVACRAPVAGAPTPRDAISLVIPRPGAAWPSGSAACTLVQTPPSSTTDCDYVRVDVTRTRGGAAIARFESTYGRGKTVWSELPRLGDARTARVEATDGGLHIHGFASLASQSFTLRRAVEVAAGHAWVLPGRPIAILGTTAGQIAIQTETPFAAPHEYETAVPCDWIGAPERGSAAVEGKPRRPPAAIARAREMTILVAPNGPPLLTITPTPSQPFAWLQERDGFVRLATYENGSSAFAVDGWVRARDVTRADHLDFDTDFGDCPDSVDRCLSDRTVRTSRVFVGDGAPEGDAIGTLDAGTAIVLGDHRGGFVAFVTPERVLSPSHGAFWVAEADMVHDAPCTDP